MEQHSPEIIRLSDAPYLETWGLQRERAAAVAARCATEALLLVEHTPVYTLGHRTDREHLLRSEAELRALGAEVVSVDRGGDVTWHGPGQLTGYPILDLGRRGRDLHAYVRNVEQLIIDLAATYDIEAHRFPGRPGVWVGQEKLAAIGIKVLRGWISYHGFAVNVDPDLRWFDHIVPCGLHGCGVTSLARLLDRTVSVDEVAGRLGPLFEKRFAVSVDE
jgi:lipoyl(octanoyl) transferase